MIVAILPGKKSNLYPDVKGFLLKVGIPSQIVTTATLENPKGLFSKVYKLL
jgi:hypothetical protein